MHAQLLRLFVVTFAMHRQAGTRAGNDQKAHTHTHGKHEPTNAGQQRYTSHKRQTPSHAAAHASNQHTKRELSISLVRGNARLFKKFVGMPTRGTGQRFVEGMDLPVLE